MIRFILSRLFTAVLAVVLGAQICMAQVPGQGGPMAPGGPTPLGSAVANFGGLQFGLAQSGIGAPTGTMTNYAAGDQVTLQCPGVSFSTSPTIGILAVTTGSPTQVVVQNPGISSGAVPSGLVSCSQAATTGSGTGLNVTGLLGVIASYVQPAGLSQGGSAQSNGNFFLNFSQLDAASSFSIAGAENTAFGERSCFGVGGASFYNSCFGLNAGGSGSGLSAIAVQGMSVFGTDALRNIETQANFLTAFGSGAGRNAANIGSVYIGYEAGGSSGTNSAGTVSGNTSVVIGYLSGSALTSGASDILIGERSGSAITSGNNDFIVNAGTGADACANGNESNVVALCAGGGRVFTISGAGTPSTSVATLPGAVTMPALVSSSLATTGTVCWTTGTGNLTVDTTTTCLLSLEELKDKTEALDGAKALDEVTQMQPFWGTWKKDTPEYAGDKEEQPFLGAHQLESIDPRLVAHDADGKLHGVRYQELTAVLVAAISEEKRRVDLLMIAVGILALWCAGLTFVVVRRRKP
jgi:hypothetical protein